MSSLVPFRQVIAFLRETKSLSECQFGSQRLGSRNYWPNMCVVTLGPKSLESSLEVGVLLAGIASQQSRVPSTIRTRLCEF